MLENRFAVRKTEHNARDYVIMVRGGSAPTTSSEDRQHVEGRWPKPPSGVVPPTDVDTVVEAPTTSTSRQVTEIRAGLKVQIDVGPKSTGASREPDRLNLVDTHFHFDRMVRGRHD